MSFPNFNFACTESRAWQRRGEEYTNASLKYINLSPFEEGKLSPSLKYEFIIDNLLRFRFTSDCVYSVKFTALWLRSVMSVSSVRPDGATDGEGFIYIPHIRENLKV